jgi:hypothetical protein
MARPSSFATPISVRSGPDKAVSDAVATSLPMQTKPGRNQARDGYRATRPMQDAARASPGVAKVGPEQVGDGLDVARAGVVEEQADGRQRRAGLVEWADAEAEVAGGDGKPSGRITFPKAGQCSG